MTRSALGSSSAMCTLEPELAACDVPTRSMGAPRPAMTAPRSVYQRPRSDSELVASLHDRSGLTWEQLARAIGVSRRSLHMQAAGSTVTYAHRRVMERFDLLVTSIGMTPAETWVKLLEQRPGGGSLLDDFRRDCFVTWHLVVMGGFRFPMMLWRGAGPSWRRSLQKRGRTARRESSSSASGASGLRMRTTGRILSSTGLRRPFDGAGGDAGGG